MLAANANFIMPMQQATFKPSALAIIYSNRKAPIIKTALPEASFLSMQDHYDYSACNLTTFKDMNNKVQPDDLALAFFTAVPNWLNVLFIAKDFIENRFSFKTLRNSFRRKSALKHFSIESGENIHFFKVLHKNDNEIVFEQKGRYVTVLHSLLLLLPRKDSTQKNVMISTAVTFHNAFGQYYFLLTKLFLEYITPLVLKRTLKNLKTFQ